MIFIAGNLPMKTEITPLLIVIKLEQFDYVGAAALGLVMLCVSFVMLFTINAINGWRIAPHGGEALMAGPGTAAGRARTDPSAACCASC